MISETFFSISFSFPFLFFSSGRRSKILLINLRNFCFRYTLDGEIYLFLIENICACTKDFNFPLWTNDKNPIYIRGSNNIENNKIFTSNTYIVRSYGNNTCTKGETRVTNCNRIRQLIDNIPIELSTTRPICSIRLDTIIKSDENDYAHQIKINK